MSDQIKHECGLAMIRLLKPLEYYHEKYGSAFYGLNKLQLLLQKQRNRGQDGAGIATIKLDSKPGTRYISRKRSNSPQYLVDLFNQVFQRFDDCTEDQLNDPVWLKENKPYLGELLLGHLRYGTHGSNSIETVHPFLRLNNWISRNLVVAGNFNLTNVQELFSELIELGQYPKEMSDTVTVMEKIGHFLDDEVQRLFNWFKPEGYSNQDINKLIAEHLDVQRILQRSCRKFDGGYVMAGMVGHGDAFVLRDSSGIRPCFFYHDDEIAVIASERPAIQTALNVKYHDVKELKIGHALIIKKNGVISEVPVKDQIGRKSCSFERIYFSRGTDKDIYLERKKLGKLLAKKVLGAVNHDFENTIFSFIPNTAEVAFYGLVEGLHDSIAEWRKEKIQEINGKATSEQLEKIFNIKPRIEKLVVKDAKMRTFIANDSLRGQMVSHVYDVTYGMVKNKLDTVVLIDDSIVRGTTLRDSIIQIVSTLQPKKIVIVSSAPQIRYPDCYGIDMSKMKNFVAFKALLHLLDRDDKMHLLDETYKKCKAQLDLPPHEMKNEVKSLYANYSYEEVSKTIAKIVTPDNISPEIEVIYQTVEDLHEACPNNTGDWYFTGEYPTPGGIRVVNKAFVNFMEKNNNRAY